MSGACWRRCGRQVREHGVPPCAPVLGTRRRRACVHAAAAGQPARTLPPHAAAREAGDAMSLVALGACPTDWLAAPACQPAGHAPLPSAPRRPAAHAASCQLPACTLFHAACGHAQLQTHASCHPWLHPCCSQATPPGWQRRWRQARCCTRLAMGRQARAARPPLPLSRVARAAVRAAVRAAARRQRPSSHAPPQTPAVAASLLRRAALPPSRRRRAQARRTMSGTLPIGWGCSKRTWGAPWGRPVSPGTQTEPAATAATAAMETTPPCTWPPISPCPPASRWASGVGQHCWQGSPVHRRLACPASTQHPGAGCCCSQLRLCPPALPQVLVRAAEERGGQEERQRYLDAADAKGITALMQAVHGSTEETVRVRAATRGRDASAAVQTPGRGRRPRCADAHRVATTLPAPAAALPAGAAGCWRLPQPGGRRWQDGVALGGGGRSHQAGAVAAAGAQAGRAARTPPAAGGAQALDLLPWCTCRFCWTALLGWTWARWMRRASRRCTGQQGRLSWSACRQGHPGHPLGACPAGNTAAVVPFAGRCNQKA